MQAQVELRKAAERREARTPVWRVMQARPLSAAEVVAIRRRHRGR